ncbi:MAG: DUF4347 domain-containing protein, partial [Cyanobacteria bacterium P01_H01_bin.35]
MNLLTANQNDNILCQNYARNGFLVSKRSPGLGMLVVIDPRVENYGMLVSGVLPEAKVVILESGEDGVRQVSRAIFDYPVSSLHIVGHGSPGSMQLGNTGLSLGNLAAYGAELEKWGRAIGCGGIFLYGCEVAAGDIGAAFVERLHELSGVGVAAAVGRVGCAELGGSWELGVKVGNVGDGLAFGEEVLVSYGGIFAENILEELLFSSQIEEIPGDETIPNSPPVANSNSIIVDEGSQDIPVGLTAPTDVDPEDILTINVSGLPILGIVTKADGTVVNNGETLTADELEGLLYDAPPDFNGTDDPGDFTYSV